MAYLIKVPNEFSVTGKFFTKVFQEQKKDCSPNRSHIEIELKKSY